MNQPRPPQHTAGPPRSATSPSPAYHAAGQPSSSPQTDPAAVTAAAALSHDQHSPTPESANTNGRKRRPSGAPGSRGVANLNPDQLAKKRANDREAQRAIRERTRNTIETLERRIRDLESQQPYQDLQRAIADRDRALSECDSLRKRLGMVAALAAGNTQPALHELAALTAQQSPLPSLPHQAQHHHSSSFHSSHGGHEHPQQHNEMRSPHGYPHMSPTGHPAASVPVYHAGENNLRRWSSNADHTSHPQMSPPSASGSFDHSRGSIHTSQIPQNNGERLGLNFVLDPTQSNKTSTPTSITMAYPSPSAHEQALPTRLPANSTPNIPLDSLLNNFMNSRRELIRSGVPVREVIGPDMPSLVGFSIADPSKAPNCHPISALLIDILSKFPDIYALPEQVAVLYIMFLVMRWSICPCEQCYEKLPEWARPTMEQLERPHPIWVDNLPWPYMRRALIAGPVQFEEFFVPYTTTLSLNWPYSRDSIIIPTPGANPDDPSAVHMNPAFEAHIRDLRNWSLGSKFRQTFPNLVDDSVHMVDTPRM